MITVHGKFQYSIITLDDGSEMAAYPYGIDYKKIDGRTGYFQCRKDESTVYPHYTIINWILTDVPLQ